MRTGLPREVTAERNEIVIIPGVVLEAAVIIHDAIAEHGPEVQHLFGNDGYPGR